MSLQNLLKTRKQNNFWYLILQRCQAISFYSWVREREETSSFFNAKIATYYSIHGGKTNAIYYSFPEAYPDFWKMVPTFLWTSWFINFLDFLMEMKTNIYHKLFHFLSFLHLKGGTWASISPLDPPLHWLKECHILLHWLR